MANYSLVVDAKFRPFSYQELLAPALMMTQAHQQVEDQYAELSSKANIWDKMANEQTDKKAHAIYKQYADDLRDKANQLSSYGLDPQSRQEMLNMRSRYSSEIVPIEQAYKKREEQALEQRRAMLQNPTLLLSRKASTTSLDDYLDNPNLDYQSYSGALLTQQASQMAQQLAKELSSTNVGRVDSYTNLLKNKYGLTKSDIMEAAINPNSSKATKALNAISAEVLKASGISSWKDKQISNTADSYIRQGWWSAIGPEQAQMFENKGAVMAAQFAHDEDMENLRYTHQAALARNNNGTNNGTNNDGTIDPNKHEYAPRNVMTEDERASADNDAKNFNKWVKEGYFYKTKNGNWALTTKGLKNAYVEHTVYDGAYQEPGISKSSGYGSKPRKYKAPTALGSWLNNNGFSGMLNRKVGRWQTQKFENLKNRYAGATDATLATEYTRSVSPSQYDNVIGLLNGASDNNNEVSTFSMSKSGNSYALTPSDKFKVNDISSEDIKSAQIVYGVHGNYVEITLKGQDGKFRVPMSSLNNSIDKAVTQIVNRASAIKKSGASHIHFNVATNSFSNNPDDPYISSDDAINKILNDASRTGISIFGTGESEPDKITQGIHE